MRVCCLQFNVGLLFIFTQIYFEHISVKFSFVDYSADCSVMIKMMSDSL